MRSNFNSFRFPASNDKIFYMHLKSMIWWGYLPDLIVLLTELLHSTGSSE